MALNFIFSTFLTYFKNSHKFLKIDIFVETMIAHKHLYQEQSTDMLANIFKEAETKNYEYLKVKKLIALIGYYVSLIVYAIIILCLNPKGVKAIGVINVVLIAVTDQMYA